jgi:PAS domain S-box-containing protein
MRPPMTTHERRIERALEKSEARFRQVVESAPNAMVMIRATGQIEMVNAQAEKVFGYPRDELLGQPVEMLVPMRFRELDPQLRASFFGDPRSSRWGAGRDLFGLRRDGSEFALEIGLNTIETEEGPMVLSAIVDISDRKLKEDRVKAALKEKEVLLGEIHHRVKNNLQIIDSLLSLQFSKVKDKTALALVKESQARIRSMALIHQTLYESRDFALVDFKRFLDSLVHNLVASYSIDSGRVTLQIRAQAVALPIKAAIPCGLIVNELISNALKHAFPDDRSGRIDVDLTTEPSGVMLTVCDDGVGIDDTLDLVNATTLGLQLVTLLADQLGATMDVHRSAPTRFCLRFPVES